MRLFSPPMDLLFYNREPLVSTGRVTIPPGALSCHDHGPPPGAAPDFQEASGSSWHARGYDEDESRDTQGAAGIQSIAGAQVGTPPREREYSHRHGNWLAHRHGHGHTSGHSH